MQVNTFVKKLTDIEKALFEDHCRSKLSHLNKYLTEFDEDAVKLNMTVEKFTNKNAYKVELTMELPKAASHPLHASEDSHDLMKAIDFAVKKLVDQVKKAMEKLHHEHEHAA